MVKNQSERPLGAFYFLYFNEFKEVPPKISDKCTAFRNNVIHKGYIPKIEEVHVYAKEIYDYIINISKKLGLNYRDFIQKPFIQRQMNFKKERENENISVQSIRTMIDLALADELFDEKSFEEALQEVRNKIGTQFFK